MYPLTNLEKDVLRRLVSPRIGAIAIESSDHATAIDFTDYGYFLRIEDPRLPEERFVFSRPVLMASGDGFECGFVCFVESHQLTLECHTWGDERLPKNIRTLPMNISLPGQV